MKRTLKAILAAVAIFALFGLTACKSDAEKLVGYMEEMADIMDKNKDDCDKMAEELSSFAKDNGKEITELSKKLKDDKEAEEKYKDRVEKATEKMMGGMMKCADNEKVMKAMQEIKME